MPRSGFEPAIQATTRAQTCALDHEATGIGPRYITTQHFRALLRYTSVAVNLTNPHAGVVNGKKLKKKHYWPLEERCS
jgi:hypothetical protein